MPSPKKPKIALVGPIHPYRGGIAQYTGELAKAFSKYVDTRVYSFSKLYPGFLYPGKSDKVVAIDEVKSKNTDYSISVYSPRSWSKTASRIHKDGYDVAIIVWWTFFWQPMLGFIAWRLKRKGVKVIYLCHNITDHEENWAKKQISKKAIGIADGYILHSYEEASKLKKLKPNANILRRVHPIYIHFPKPAKKLKKQGKLEILYFGLIRPYKGVDVLLSAMEKLNDKEVYLTIIGEVWGDKNRENLVERIKELKDSGINIDYKFEYVDEKEAANHFAHTDVVVLPYLSATGSGVVTLAYNYGKPVIASAVGGLSDVVIDDQTGWLISSKAPDELARTIAKADRDKVEEMAPSIRKFCKENSWENMAKEIIKFSSGV
jgi:glycosyltransferase involved in cell wall biosynthesis